MSDDEGGEDAYHMVSLLQSAIERQGRASELEVTGEKGVTSACDLDDPHLVDLATDNVIWDRQREPLRMLTPRERNYWLCRRNNNLYQRLRSLVQEHGASAESILDVGAYVTPFVNEFDWIPEKATTDRQLDRAPADYFEALNVTAFLGDFMTIDFPRRYDIVLCFEVVEHLTDDVVQGFVQRLLEVGKTVIVSTTFELPEGIVPGHVQDPISREEFVSWFGDSADDVIIETLEERPNWNNIIGVVRG